MKVVVRLFTLLVVTIASSAFLSAAEPSHQKKLIEWGWDEPDPGFMRAHIAEMERFPFDGVIFHINDDKGASLTWELWGSRQFSADAFRKPIDDLRATKFQRLTDRFLRVNVTPGNIDWFDDSGWKVIRENFGVAAKIAKKGGCKGFMFDVEQYQQQPFDFRKQKQREKKSFAEYQAKVRQRGQEWMQEVNRYYPNITILMTYAYEIALPHPGQKDRSQIDYGLLADFLDGLLTVCTKETRLVDAFEDAYGFKRPEEFELGYRAIKQKALKWTSKPDEYRRHVQAGFGIWMDNEWNRHGWNAADFSKNYFKPDVFEKSVRAALNATDEYVWIYTEKPRWWTNEALPAAYIEALTRAAAGKETPKPR